MCRTPSPARQASGFTLIEIMIGLAVLAILAALAMPSYLDAIRKNRRSEGIAALSQLQQSQERWRANAATYTTALTTASPNGLGLPGTTEKGFYTVAIGAADATSYTATASAVSGSSQANDRRCKVLAVRMTGGNIGYGAGATSGTLDWADPNRCWAR